MIDSPGHVDFFGEVSTAIRLCDGCLILIDVIEGVCSQTKSALQQAWIERIKPVLVLNKIDRLLLERKMCALDIYMHLIQILEQINAFLGELFTSDVLGKCAPNSLSNEESSNQTETPKDTQKQTYDWSSGLDDVDDSSVYFSPENGNVVFGSAIDGWGFTIKDFSKFLSNKYGIKEDVLNKTLWGDFYLNTKEKKIMKGAQSKAKKPLFVTMVLENIYAVYEAIIVRRDKLAIQKILNSLGVKFTTRDLNHSDSRTQLQLLFSQWLPLSDAVLRMVCELIPSPLHINEERVENLMCSNTRRFDSLPLETQNLKNAFIKCSADSDSPLIICVSKMFAFEKKFLPQYKPRPLTHEEIQMRRQQRTAENKHLVNQNEVELSDSKDIKSEDIINGSKEKAYYCTENFTLEESKTEDSCVDTESKENDSNVFIAFARIFSGTVKRDDTVFVLGPKHNPNKINDSTHIDSSLTLNDLPANQHITKCQIEDLYILMGKELEVLEEGRAGNIIGIGGLEKHILKSATISSTIFCPTFIDLHISTIPILRVALEPQNPSEMPKLVEALKMLNQADPCVEVKIQETGEHVIVTTGEVHLQRCIDDLTNFSGIEINCSPPIVPFRETIIEKPKLDMVNELISDQKSNKITTEESNETSIVLWTVNKKSKIKILAKPLPEEVCKLLDSNSQLLKLITKHQRKYRDNFEQFTDQTLSAIEELRLRLKKAFCDSEWPEDTIDRIWSFGPKYCGTNILLNRISDFHLLNSCFGANAQNLQLDKFSINDMRYQFENNFVSGFQMATLSGPLCDEPLMGVCFIVEEWMISDVTQETSNDPFGPFSGQIMSTVKECCKRAFQAQPQRLMAAMFSSTIQVDSDALGEFRFLILYLFECLSSRLPYN